MNLAGPTISLVPLQLAHVTDFIKYSAEPSLWTWWLRAPPVDEPTMRKEVEWALTQQAAGTRIPFSIYHQALGEHIGSTSLWYLDQTAGTVEIGATWLGLPFQKTGVNRECKTLLIEHAFGALGLNAVKLQTDELNLRSRRAIEKLGARLVETRPRDKVTWNGRVRTSVVYELRLDDWQTGTKAQTP